MIRKRLFCLQLTLILFTSACLFPLAANARDIYSDTWVAADGLDRILPTAEEAGAVKENKYVGIFYFLFCLCKNIFNPKTLGYFENLIAIIN